VEDDRGRRVVGETPTGGVLEVEKAVGLGVEAEVRDGGLPLVVGELAVEAEELAEEAEESAVEGAEEGGLPGGGGSGLAGVRVEERLSEPEDEVPTRVAAGEEVVAEAELAEELVNGLPGPQAIAVEEDSVEDRTHRS